MSLPDTTSIRAFRAGDWWTSKAALLMGFVYLFALWFRIPFGQFVPLTLCSVVVIAGFASFGYLVNDFFDKEQDQLAGKRNSLLNKPVAYQLVLVSISLLCIGLPWIYLPATRVSAVLIIVQLLLFIAYSAPPIRLKERGAVGILIDALYAHALPVILAAYTFLLASPVRVVPYALIILGSWQLLSGIRNILIHQSEDRDADIRSGTRTYIGSISYTDSLQLIRAVLVSELLLCLTFFGWLTGMDVQFGFAVMTVGAFSAIAALVYFGTPHAHRPPEALRYFPNNIYEKWLPVVYLCLLSYFDGYFVILLVAHVALFGLGFYQKAAREFFVVSFYQVVNVIWIPVRRLLSAVANFAIYHVLLIFRIDLKKEQMSAVEYFKRKWSNN